MTVLSIIERIDEALVHLERRGEKNIRIYLDAVDRAEFEALDTVDDLSFVEGRLVYRGFPVRWSAGKGSKIYTFGGRAKTLPRRPRQTKEERERLRRSIEAASPTRLELALEEVAITAKLRQAAKREVTAPETFPRSKTTAPPRQPPRRTFEEQLERIRQGKAGVTPKFVPPSRPIDITLGGVASGLL